MGERNSENADSEKQELREVVDWECVCDQWSLGEKTESGDLVLLAAEVGLRGMPSQPTVGDALGVWEPDLGEREALGDLPTLPGRWFLALNFSSQTGSLTWEVHSAFPRVDANLRASSRIRASLMGSFSARRFLAQLERVRSMSGNLDLFLRGGERRPSSGIKYLSFWRRTFETVLGSLLDNIERKRVC